MEQNPYLQLVGYRVYILHTPAPVPLVSMKAPLASRRAPPGARGVFFWFWGGDVWDAGKQVSRRRNVLGICCT